jgi:class 3 adenylate cyclase
MELRPELRRLYTAVTDLATYAPIVTPLGFVPVEEANVTLGGVVYHTAMLDFGPASVDGWLSRLIGTELGVDADAEQQELPSGTLTILFADIAESVRLTEEIGDEAFRNRARHLDAALRSIIEASGGKTIEGKLVGDGVMAVYGSARQAIDGALGCAAASAETKLGLHLGLHAGDVIREEGNVFGGAVNIASRIAALSAPGEVLASDTVRGLARTSAGVRFEDRGEHHLKGLADGQRLFAIRTSD